MQGGKGKQNELACAGGRTGQLRAAEGMREGQDKGMQNRAARWELTDLRLGGACKGCRQRAHISRR